MNSCFHVYSLFLPSAMEISQKKERVQLQGKLLMIPASFVQIAAQLYSASVVNSVHGIDVTGRPDERTKVSIQEDSILRYISYRTKLTSVSSDPITRRC